jgi:hypothetical protein
MLQQINDETTKKPGDLEKLLRGKEVWTIE